MSKSTVDLLLCEVRGLSYIDDVASYKRPVGYLGNSMYTFWGKQVEGYNVTYEAVKEECIIQNQTFFDDVCVLHRNEKDASIPPQPMVIPSGVIEYLGVLTTETAIIMNAPYMDHKAITILEAFNVFSANTWLFLVFGILAIAFTNRIYCKLDMLVHILGTYRCYVNQMNLQKQLQKSLLIVTALMFSSFAFVQIWENLVHTDMVAKDFSKVIDSLHDLWRLKQYTPCVFDRDAFTHVLARSQTKQLKDIWSRVVKDGPDKTLLSTRYALDEIARIQSSHAVIGSQTSTISLLRMGCGKSAKKYKSWKARESLGDLPYDNYIKPDISPKKRAVLKRRARRLTEAALHVHNRQLILNGVPGMPFSETCETEKLDDLSEENDSHGISSAIFKPLIVMLAMAMSLISLVFLLEMFRII